MLKQRVLTAAILAPLMLWAIWSLSTASFALIIALFVILAAWEWGGIINPNERLMRMIYPAVITALLVAINQRLDPELWWLISGVGIFWLLIVTALILRFPRISPHWGESPLLKSVVGLLILLPAWVSLVLLHQHYGPEAVILLLLMIWSADSGAYFAGRRWGRRKLAPQVSPGKSWEGVIGGMLLAAIVTPILAALFSWELPLPLFLLLTLLTVAVSVIGDLGESLYKRMVGIKDSSQILPGHGGVLDRIDSLTVAAPFFYLGLGLIQ